MQDVPMVTPELDLTGRYSGVDLDQLAGSDGVVWEQRGIAVVSMHEAAATSVGPTLAVSPSILSLEPEGIMHALADGQLSTEYLRGFRDAATLLADWARARSIEPTGEEVAVSFADNDKLTWGLQATRAGDSRVSGRGIRVGSWSPVLTFDIRILFPVAWCRSRSLPGCSDV